MTQEKWLDLVNMIQDKFQVEENVKEPFEDGPGEKTILVFSMPAGRFRLERLVKPRVLDKKTTYTHRAGGDVKVQYVYSQDEFVDKLSAYKWNESSQSWVEIEPEAFKL